MGWGLETLGPLLEEASGTEGSGQGPEAHLGDKECKVQQMSVFKVLCGIGWE